MISWAHLDPIHREEDFIALLFIGHTEGHKAG
jgi:hypothetical protein